MNSGSILLEDLENSTFHKDENPTATFLFKDPGEPYGSDTDITSQFFMIEHYDKAYAIGYTNDG